MEKFRSFLISHSQLVSATQQGVGWGDILHYNHHKGNFPQVKVSLMGILLTLTSFCYFDLEHMTSHFPPPLHKGVWLTG